MPKVSRMARKQEQVAAGEMPGQRRVALHAAEDEVGIVALQLFAQGSVADPDVARVGSLLLQLAESRDGE